MKRRFNKVMVVDNSPYKGQNGLRLHLGCGAVIKPGYINIDKNESDQVVGVDLEKAKLPFDDESVVEIVADQVFEHIMNFNDLMAEMHRVLVPRGQLICSVPHASFAEAFQDPTHCKFFTDKTFLYWLKGDPFFEGYGRGYGFKSWSQLIQRMNGWCLNVKMRK
jgi:ubiquinone/menaquinone biosynthesis C-methylase UbiE